MGKNSFVIIAAAASALCSCKNFQTTSGISGAGWKNQKNLSYEIGGHRITLVDGRNETEVIPDSASKLITRYFGNEVHGDFDCDGWKDVAFLLTQDGGGSGTFYYVAAALGSADGYSGINACFLGDRIAPQTTEFRNGEIVVNYMDRKQGEPMTASPSVAVSRYFRIANSKLVESLK